MDCARVYDHQHLGEMVEHATVPVINMLSDVLTPQALADAMTIMDEFGRDLNGTLCSSVMATTWPVRSP